MEEVRKGYGGKDSLPAQARARSPLSRGTVIILKEALAKSAKDAKEIFLGRKESVFGEIFGKRGG